MHPIHYSLLMNLAILVIAGALSWELREPAWLIVAMLLQNHTLGRFSNQDMPQLDDDDDGDPSRDPSIGFGANIR